MKFKKKIIIMKYDIKFGLLGFETNLNNNSSRKELKYRPLLIDLARGYKQITFINLSISSLGIFGNCSDSFLKLCMERGINNGDLKFIISKISSIIIRSTYYIFCMKNKPWPNPGLLSYEHLCIQLLGINFISTVFFPICKPAKYILSCIK